MSESFTPPGAPAIKLSATVPITLKPWTKRSILWCTSFIAFVLSCTAVGSCRFVQLSQQSGAGSAVTVTYFGLFQFAQGAACVSWDLITDGALLSLSSSEEAARAFGVMAALFGGLAMLGIMSVYCFHMEQKKWRAIGGVLIACVIFQSFTFILLDSPKCKAGDGNVRTKCHLDEGGAMSIVAMLFYMFAAIGVFMIPVPSPGDVLIDFSGQLVAQDQLRSVTEVINPDGTKTIFVTTTAGADLPRTKETTEMMVETSIGAESPDQTDEENPPPLIEEKGDIKISVKETFDNEDTTEEDEKKKRKKKGKKEAGKKKSAPNLKVPDEEEIVVKAEVVAVKSTPNVYITKDEDKSVMTEVTEETEGDTKYAKASEESEVAEKTEEV